MPASRFGQDDGDKDDSHQCLSQRGSQSRAGDPHVQPVDEQRVEGDVECCTSDGNIQRRGRIEQAAQCACGRQDNEHSDQAGRGRVQVGERVRHDVR